MSDERVAVVVGKLKPEEAAKILKRFGRGRGFFRVVVVEPKRKKPGKRAAKSTVSVEYGLLLVPTSRKADG